MNELDREPSPRRFCSRLGIRNAAAKASAAGPRPSTERSNDSLKSPVRRESSIPALIFFALLVVDEESSEDINSYRFPTKRLLEGVLERD